jgi:hypothetical protein
MKGRMLSKGLAVAVIILLSISVTPSFGIPFDDTIPPVTTHNLDPPEPTGENGWYVDDVSVTLNATDDMSGVNVTYYRIDYGIWMEYSEPFTLSKDGDDILIEYYSVDYAGNVEDIKSLIVDIDQTHPDIGLMYEIYENNTFIFTATALDEMSGMERIEFYNYSRLQEVVYGLGPEYHWIVTLDILTSYWGFICKKEITEEYIRFFAICIRQQDVSSNLYSFSAHAYDNAGNSHYDWIQNHPPRPEYHYFKWFTLNNYYGGYIWRFLIFATFSFILPPTC